MPRWKCKLPEWHMPRVEWKRMRIKIRYFRFDMDFESMKTIEYCAFCIPLQWGSIFIGIFGLVYGVIGLWMFLSIPINLSDWKPLYEKKNDLLLYLFATFGIIALVLFASIVLLVGIALENEDLVKTYLWCIALHILLDWLCSAAVVVFCLAVEQECFQGSGIVAVLVDMILTVFYTLFWGYLFVIVNSYREEM